MNRMYKLVAVLLVALIIGVTPAIAIPHGETAGVMAVKGKGTAEFAVQILENGSTGTEDNSTVTTEPIGNNDPAPAEATGADVQVPVASANEDTQDLNISENDTIIAENTTIPQIDTTGIVMQSTDYSCGPAALATVLQNMGINSTEGELKVLAGTDTSGTTMHGLSEAAKVKGVNAVGMRLSVDDLRPNNIVHIILDGEGHYSVIRKISSESVYLADPSLGNIEMTREKFNEIYTGNALLISGPLNQTAEQANSSTENLTDTGSIQPENSQTLTTGEMQSIRGQGAWVQVWVKGWFYSWYEWVYDWYCMVIPPHGITHSDRISFVWVKGWHRRWGWYRKVYGWHKVWRLVETLPWTAASRFTPPWPYY
jgi:predicted double-glycine peptidase